MGLEKLKEGRGKGIEASELTDGERWNGPGLRLGDAVDIAYALQLESLRGGKDWMELPIELSSPVFSRGEDMDVGDREA